MSTTPENAATEPDATVIDTPQAPAADKAPTAVTEPVKPKK